MKRLTVNFDRYQQKNRAQATGAAAQSDVQQSRGRGRRSKATCRGDIDDKTIVYLCNQYLRTEYGRRGAVAVQAVRIHGSVVVIAVESALWAQEIWMRRAAIVRHINELCGAEVLTKVIAEVR